LVNAKIDLAHSALSKETLYFIVQNLLFHAFSSLFIETFPHTLWFKRISSFRSLLLAMSYQWFTFIRLVTLPLAPLHLLLADWAFPSWVYLQFPAVTFADSFKQGRLLALRVAVEPTDDTVGSAKNNSFARVHVADG